MTLNVQFLSMISMVISGIYLGMARETFQRCSPIWRRHIVFIYVAEILFWFLQTVIIFFILYSVNYGELRVYTFLSLLLGYSIYVVIFQSLYKRLLTLFIKFLRFLIRVIHRIITIFIIRPLQFIIKVITTILLSIFSLLMYVINLLLYPVKFIFKKLNSKLPKNNFFINKLTTIYSIIKDKLKKR